MDQDFTQGMSAAVVYNPTAEDFTTSFNLVRGGQEYTIPAGGNITVSVEIGKHLAKTMVMSHIFRLEGRFGDVLKVEKVAAEINKILKIVPVDGNRLVEEAQQEAAKPAPKEKEFGGLDEDLSSKSLDELKDMARERKIDLRFKDKEKLIEALSK